MEEYLTIDELCGRIKYRKQTVYNLIHRKVFILGKHFLKPTPKKILFKWSEIKAWIGECFPPDPEPNRASPPENTFSGGDAARSSATKRISLIRI